MSRRLLSTSALGAVLFALTVAIGPVGAGTGPGTTVNIVKVVDGPVPAGTTFSVALDCDADSDDEVLLFTEAGGTQSISTGTFNQSCTIAETDDGGADSVAYACVVDDPGGGLVPPVPTSCTTETDFVTGLNGEITLTITNTFEDEVIVDPPPDVDDDDDEPADVVAATPPFTG